MGLSDKPEDGYDTGTLAGDLVSRSWTRSGTSGSPCVGHDTGFAVSYALAADHPDRVERVALAEIPGLPGRRARAAAVPPRTGQRPAVAPPVQPDRRAERGSSSPDGRTIFFRWEFDAAAKALPDEVIDYYVAHFASSPEALRASFGFYRALDTTIAQDEGAQGRAPDHARPRHRWRDELRSSTSGRHCRPSPTTCRAWSSPAPATSSPRRLPEEMLAALAPFLAPYRDGADADRPGGRRLEP